MSNAAFKVMRSNRTFMELKLLIQQCEHLFVQSSNRTFMELKSAFIYGFNDLQPF